MYKISVIVPIYNVEEFIEEAIESVVNQSIGFENIELILIDDCSTDRSGEIAEKYSQKYENIIYYKLPENSGMAGKPRNIGIKMATAKYLMFLDPDDIFFNNSCEIMYKKIEEKELKFISANYTRMDIYKNIIVQNAIDKNKYISQEFFVHDMKNTMRLLTLSCCNKIINRKFIIEKNILFLEGVPGEDAYFSSKLFFEAERGFYLDEPIYGYRKRTTGNLSVTTNLNEKFFKNLIIANKNIFELCDEYSKYRYYKYYYTSNFIYFIRSLMVSDKISKNKKAEILFSIKDDLLNYAKKIEINFNLDIDTIDFCKVFFINTINDFEIFIFKMENLIKKIGTNEFKDLVERIMNELESQI